MKKFRLSNIAAAAVVTASVMAPVNSWAVAAYVTNMWQATTAISSAASSIVGSQSATASAELAAKTAQTTALVTAIGQAASALDAQIKNSINAQAANTDAAFKMAWAQKEENDKTAFKMNNYAKLVGAPCEVVTSVAAAKVSAAGRKVSAGAAIAGGNSVQRDLTSLSPQADLERRLKEHKNVYCDPSTSQNCGGGASPKLRNADVKAESLFMGAGAAIGGEVATFDAEQVKAANDYIDNLIKPIKEPALDAETENTPAGRAYVAMKNADAARSSLARMPLQMLVAKKDPANTPKGLSAALKAIWKTDPGVTIPAGEISFQQMMDIEAEKRYGNKDWYKSMSDASDVQLLKEMAYMQAQEIYQRHQQIKQMDQLLGIVATMYHEQSEATNGPKLAAQRDAAIKSRR